MNFVQWIIRYNIFQRAYPVRQFAKEHCFSWTQLAKKNEKISKNAAKENSWREKLIVTPYQMLRWRYLAIRCCGVGWQTGQTGQTGRRRQMSRKWASGAVHFSRTGGQISCKLGNGRLASHRVEVVEVLE